MSGYQPKMRCNSCTKKNDCKKYKEDKVACKKYDGMQSSPPKTLASAFRKQVPMPEVKPTKQRTVLSVRDFAILMNIANMYISKLENDTMSFYYNLNDEERQKRKDENMAELQRDPLYQDLLRIRDKLGELNIEVETPSVEVEE